MRRKTVKGLVLDNPGNDIILLTRDGEFLRFPAGARPCSPGMEMEVAVPFNKRRTSFMLSAAGIAAAIFIAIALFLIQSANIGPEAYLAVDINPGVIFSLNKDAVVIKAHPTSEEGKKILEMLEMEGAGVLEAVALLLEAAREGRYLSPGRDNFIVISLAAPQHFSISEEEIRASISDQLYQMEVDTYLKIICKGTHKVQVADQMEIPLSALLLGEEIKDSIISEEVRSLLEGSPPLSVREFLHTVNPADVFNKNEFVPGERSKVEKPSGISPPPVKIPDADGEGEGEEPVGDPDSHIPADRPTVPSRGGTGREQGPGVVGS